MYQNYFICKRVCHLYVRSHTIVQTYSHSKYMKCQIHIQIGRCDKYHMQLTTALLCRILSITYLVAVCTPLMLGYWLLISMARIQWQISSREKYQARLQEWHHKENLFILQPHLKFHYGASIAQWQDSSSLIRWLMVLAFEWEVLLSLCSARRSYQGKVLDTAR